MYCSNSDVSLRLNLDSGQKDRASSRLNSARRRAGIEIDQMFRNYGRDVPSASTASTTLSSPASAGATTLSVASITGFSTDGGEGDVDGDSFKYTGATGSTIQGVTGISYDHATGVTVNNGEFAHVLREICADLSASIYLEDDAVFHGNSTDTVRSNVLRKRSEMNLVRLAHLGTMD